MRYSRGEYYGEGKGSSISSAGCPLHFLMLLLNENPELLGIDVADCRNVRVEAPIVFPIAWVAVRARNTVVGASLLPCSQPSCRLIHLLPLPRLPHPENGSSIQSQSTDSSLILTPPSPSRSVKAGLCVIQHRK